MVKRRDTVGLEPTGLILMGVQIPLPAPMRVWRNWFTQRT
jgi:hypothetical protein